MTPSPLRVALFLPHLDVAGGLGVHARMLLAALAPTDELELHILHPADWTALLPGMAAEPFDRSTAPRVRFHPLNIPAGCSLADPLDPMLRDAVRAIAPQVLYCSYYTGMRSPPAPQIVLFHDAGFLENPDGFGATAARRLHAFNAIRPAVQLIQCISADARDRICRRLPWPRERTAVVHHALPDHPSLYEAAAAANPADGTIAGQPLPGWQPYFFSPVGAASGFNRGRKNLPNAIKAFRQLPVGSARFIVAGTATLTDSVLAELLPPQEPGTLSDSCWFSADRAICILPTLPRSEFLVVMRHAAAVVYPSRFEGFGLPVIEAMALGVPLIAAEASSIPELAAGAALLVPPDDLTGFTAAMQQVLRDRQASAALVQRGRERLACFRPERLASEMTAMFRHVANARN